MKKKTSFLLILALVAVLGVASAAAVAAYFHIMPAPSARKALVCDEDKMRTAWELCVANIPNDGGGYTNRVEACLMFAKDIHCKEASR